MHLLPLPIYRTDVVTFPIFFPLHYSATLLYIITQALRTLQVYGVRVGGGRTLQVYGVRVGGGRFTANLPVTILTMCDEFYKLCTRVLTRVLSRF